MSWFHWGMAAGILSCFGLIQWKQRTQDKDLQANLMFYHKSIGLLLLGAAVPRLLVRAVSKVPAAPAGPWLEKMAGR
jgi:cytochrome b561